MELWERSGALGMLDDRLADRAGRVVLVTGEAGVGKSTVVKAFAARCHQRATVVTGSCDPLVTPRALGPLHDIGAQVGGRLAELLTAGAGQPALFAALMDELADPGRHRRRVLVIEDLHWADGATLDLIVFLARRIERCGALLIVTYRDDELAADHPLRTMLAALPYDAVHRIALKPLSTECVEEQAARVGRDGAEAYRLTGGNPLLVTELLAEADGTVPESVRDLILARLGSLPEPAREVARLVAVMPTRVERAVLVGHEEHVDRCIAAGVLVANGIGVAYRHELFRRAVEDSLSPTGRAALHRRALTLLRRIAETDAARLVHHAWHADDAEALLRYGRAAAAIAAGHGAHREAVAHYRAAAAHAGRLGAAERAELLEAYAVQAHLAGSWAEGLHAARQALAERSALGQPEHVGENYRWISRLAWWNGLGQEARDAAARAVDVLSAIPPGPGLAMAYSNRSQLHMAAHELADAIEWGERSRALAENLGDTGTVLHARVNIGTARLLGGDPTAADTLWRVHVAASAVGMVDHAGRALLNRATALIELADHAAGLPALEEALRYATERELDGYLQYLLGTRALLRLERCEWDDALADADESLRRSPRPGVAVMSALLARGRILAARGAEGALAALDLAAEHAYRNGEVQWVGPVAAARAEYFLFADDERRAAEEARRGYVVAVSRGHRPFADELAHFLRLAGDEDVRSCLEQDGRPQDGPVTTPFGWLAAGDWAAAAAEWDRRGRHYTRVQALAAGDTAAVAEAVDTLRALKATSALRRLRFRLRRRGVVRVPRGPRPATAANPAGLTPRQLDVLQLLAEGLSNAEIAERLVLSPKTIDHHVSAILGKLRATTRGQAVAAARRLTLVA